jgi:NCS1 family nucleobase:cation symporter-1
MSHQPERIDDGAKAALEGSYPVVQSERGWGTWALLGVSVSLAIATWDFLIGGFVGYYLGALDGIFVMTAGALVGILLIILACLPVSSRYGIDSITSSKAQLGTRGAYLAMLAQYASVIGWNCLLLIFLGRAGAAILIAIGVAGESARSTLEVAFGLLAVVGVWLLLRGGPRRVRDVGPIIAVTVVVLAAIILILLLAEFGVGKIFDAKPSAASGSTQWDIVTGFEIVVAVTLAWWPYVGGMFRLAQSPRKALWPAVIGLALAVCLVCIIGLWSSLVIPDSGGDPTTYLVDLVGVPAGVLLLAFIIAANIGTTQVGVYVSALGLKQIPFVQQRLSWDATTALALAPVAVILVLFSDTVYTHIGTFLAFVGLLFAPIVGIQLVDFYVLRRRRLNVRGLYEDRPGAPYFFWQGVNPVAIVSIGAGFASYLYLLDPVKFTSHSPYEYISASIPSGVVAAVIYLGLTRAIVIPRGLGDYGPARAQHQPVAPPPPGPREGVATLEASPD